MKTVKLRVSLKRLLCGFTAVVMAVLVCCAGTEAMAAAGNKIDTGKTGSITLTIENSSGSKKAKDGEFSIYVVANLNKEKTAWVCAEDFSASGVEFIDMDSAELAEELAKYAAENNVKAAERKEVKEGKVKFSDLAVGAYLLVQSEDSTGFYTVDPFLITVPMDDGSGWVYDVFASPKAQVIPAEEASNTAETKEEKNTAKSAKSVESAEKESKEEKKSEAEIKAEEKVSAGEEEEEELAVKANESSTSPKTGASLAALATTMALAAAGAVVVTRKKKEDEE